MPLAHHVVLRPLRLIDRRRNFLVNPLSQSIQHTTSLRRRHPPLPIHLAIPTSHRSNLRRFSAPKRPQTEVPPTAHYSLLTSIMLHHL